MKRIIKTSLVILVVAVLAVGGGFYLINQLRASVGEKLGIYLLKKNELVISDDDIVWYDPTSYKIKLTEEGVNKIEALNVTDLMHGEPFVLRIGTQEIYNGSFWTPISSYMPRGISIILYVWRNCYDSICLDNTVDIIYGQSPQNEDLRNDPKILDHFQKLGKLMLTTTPSPTFSPSPTHTQAGFGIYFLENNTLLISDADILSYNWTSQEIAITGEASEKLIALGDRLYRFDTGFVIKIDGEEIYRGIFRTAFMSAIPGPPQISIEFPVVLPSQSENLKAIRMFYPFFQPPDDQKASNTKIFEYFEQNNKLKY